MEKKRTELYRASGLSTGYKRKGRYRYVSRRLELELSVGEVAVLAGPNGAGKSTLLRTLGGLQSPIEGRIFIEGRALGEMSARERAQVMSMLLTGGTEPGHLSVERLVSFGRYPHSDFWGRLGERDREIIIRSLKISGAWELRHRKLDELSDGERQKVMVARALAQEPRLLLMDEPTAFLDLRHKVELIELVRGISRESRTAILLSSHDLDLVLTVADKVWLMNEEGQVSVGVPGDKEFLKKIESTFHIPEHYSIQRHGRRDINKQETESGE